MYDQDLNYVDDWQCVAKRNLQALSGFWFDAVTSIPWSFLDLHSSLVHQRRKEWQCMVWCMRVAALDLACSLTSMMLYICC